MSNGQFGRLMRHFEPERAEVTRREALKATAAAAAGLLLSTRPARVLAGLAERRRAVIVGAGFAGLSCAYELKSAGWDVVVLEARKRVGGRVLSVRDFLPRGYAMEGGAELVGANHAAWEAYRERFGLSFQELPGDDGTLPVVMLQGRMLGVEEARRLYEELDRVQGAFTEMARPVDAECPWKTPGAKALDEQSLKSALEAMKDQPALGRRALAVEQAGTNGVSVEQLGLLGLLAMIKGGGLEKFWSESEVYRCVGGNMTLAEKLAESLGHERVVFEAPVSAVRERQGGVRVELKDGRAYEGDAAVVTTPPSVWPAMEFAPALPAALTRLQMGRALKLLMHLDAPAWRGSESGPGHSPYALGDGLVSATWDATPAAKAGDAAPAAMVGFSGGPGYVDTSADKGAEARLRAELAVMYPGLAKAVTQQRVMDWPTDPLVKAAYSFPAPGQLTAVGDCLQRGLGTIHFAGEHCSPGFPGYMEGALQSGIAAAKRLVG